MEEWHGSRVVRVICGLMAPFIQLFGLYVIVHGHSSPGGGFQGGAILGASFILISLSAGLPRGLQRLGLRTAVALGSVGMLIFAGVGVACMLSGGNFLDYGALPLPAASTAAVRSLTILLVEAGVGVAVMAILVTIVFGISGQPERGEGSHGGR